MAMKSAALSDVALVEPLTVEALRRLHSPLPSPSRLTTLRSGQAMAAPTEHGRPQPIAPPVPLTREEQLSITNFVEGIAEWSDDRRREMADILEPLTGATGEEGVRRLLGIGLWIRNDSEGGADTV